MTQDDQKTAKNQQSLTNIVNKHVIYLNNSFFGQRIQSSK